MVRLGPLVGFLAILIVSPTIAVSEYQGPVVSVLDGDTIEVLRNRHPERTRLSGIDCPENGQVYGKKAKQAASALASGKEVTVRIRGLDRYKRILGEVIRSDGMNLNQELVKQGWCWWYRKYAPDDAVLKELEREAREAN